jgi:MraZ protein
MSEIIYLHGVHEATADAKGRFHLPGSFKRQLEQVLDQGFIIKRSIFSRSLDLFPMATWNQIAMELRKLSRYRREDVEYIRLFTSGMQQVHLDGAQRIQIPKELIVFAGIKKDITLAAVADIIEIWDTRSYNKFIKDNSENFESMTERVMGRLNKMKENE